MKKSVKMNIFVKFNENIMTSLEVCAKIDVMVGKNIHFRMKMRGRRYMYDRYTDEKGRLFGS